MSGSHLAWRMGLKERKEGGKEKVREVNVLQKKIKNKEGF